MKSPFLTSLVLVSLTTPLFAGCSDRSKKDSDPSVSAGAPAQSATTAGAVASATPGPETTATIPMTVPVVDPFAAIAVALDETTRDTTPRLSPLQDNMSKIIDSQVAIRKATGPTTSVMADEKLAMARDDFSQKLRTLSQQDVETWSNAKGAAQVSLQNLRKVYAEYLTVPAKK